MRGPSATQSGSLLADSRTSPLQPNQIPPLCCNAARIATANPPESGLAREVVVTRFETTTSRRLIGSLRNTILAGCRATIAVSAASPSIIFASLQLPRLNAGYCENVPAAIIRRSDS